MRIRNLNKKDAICLIFLFGAYSTFNLLLINKFFPITEGWWQDYAYFINKGEVMYRDFYMFMPPGFPLLMAFLQRIFGNVLLYYRIFGFFERIVLIFIAYLLTRKLYSPEVSSFSVLTAGIIYISNIQDNYYGYYQSSLLYTFLMIYSLINLHEKLNNNDSKRNLVVQSILYGFTIFITIFFKHTVGIITGFAISVIFFIVNFRNYRKKAFQVLMLSIGTCILGLLLLGIYLQTIGALHPCLQQLFGAGSAKGDLINILFGFFPRIISWKTGIIVCGITFLCVSIFFSNKAGKKSAIWNICVFISLLVCSLLMIEQIRQIMYAPEIRETYVPRAVFVFVIFNVILLSTTIFYKPLTAKNHMFVYIIYFLLLISYIVIIYYMATHYIIYCDYLMLRNKRQYLIYALFFVEIIYSIYLLFQAIKKNDARIGGKLILTVASWAIMYVHGMSYIIEDHSVLLALSLFIGQALSLDCVLYTLKNIIIVIVFNILILGSFTQRCLFPYQWWVSNTLPTIYESTSTFADPCLKGFKERSDITETMNAIYDLIEKNKTENDTMYTFPNINYFNVMSDLYSPYYSKVHHIDVCSDAVAILDADNILNNPPTFIVYAELTPDYWAVHEVLFRGGASAGQRKIQEAIDTLVNNGNYVLLGKFQIGESNPIAIYKFK